MFAETNLTPRGYQKVTGLSAATGLTVPAGARVALIVAETQACRWRDDGTNPTTSEGLQLQVGEEFMYTGALEAIKFIELAASCTLFVAFYS